MSELDKIRRYIEKTELSRKVKDGYCMRLNEMDAFHEAMRRDEFHTLSLVFAFGLAKGYRAAKAETKRV